MIAYGKESADGSNWVRQGDESESGQLVLKKVKWTYFDAYTMSENWKMEGGLIKRKRNKWGVDQ